MEFQYVVVLVGVLASSLIGALRYHQQYKLRKQIIRNCDDFIEFYLELDEALKRNVPNTFFESRRAINSLNKNLSKVAIKEKEYLLRKTKTKLTANPIRLTEAYSLCLQLKSIWGVKKN